MKITIEIPDVNINNTLASVWADGFDWNGRKQTGFVVERENGDGPLSLRHELNAASVEHAIQLMVGGIRTDVLGRLLANDTDGPDGDVLLQLMALGELRYG